MSTKCTVCRERIKASLSNKGDWQTPDLLNQIDLIFVQILLEETEQKIKEGPPLCSDPLGCKIGSIESFPG